MPGSAETERVPGLSRNLYERSGAAAYGMTPQQFAACIDQICQKYVPELSSHDAADFCATLRLEELVLARACAAGHEQAWEDFVARYRHKMRSMAMHLTRDAAHASELADSLFAELYGMTLRDGARNSKLSYYTGRGSLEGWLRTVMSKEFVNRYRKQKHEVSLEEQADAGLQFAAPETEPVVSAEPRVEAAIDQALGELSAEDRYVLAAYHLDGRTLADVAGVLRLHESSISRRLDRMRSALRKRILAILHERGMSYAQATEALDTDVRDLHLDLRSKLAQDSSSKAFSGSKVPASDSGTDGNHV